MGAGMLSVEVALFAAALHGSFRWSIVIPDTYLHMIGSDGLQPTSVDKYSTQSPPTARRSLLKDSSYNVAPNKLSSFPTRLHGHSQ
jgi:hypothetical protein